MSSSEVVLGIAFRLILLSQLCPGAGICVTDTRPIIIVHSPIQSGSRSLYLSPELICDHIPHLGHLLQPC
jgi:hypothetical protein